MADAGHAKNSASFGRWNVLPPSSLGTKQTNNYAAMSHDEFFAEIYALYYDYDDPKRKAIPATAGKWMDDNIGKRDRENPRRSAQRREAE